MECKTKKALLFLIIGQILAIISAIVMYAVWFSIDLEDITSSNSINILFATMPGLAVGGLGGLFVLIGAVLFLLGRKEFGEKHQKFVFYAIIIFVVSIVVTIAIAGISAVVTFTSLAQDFDSSSDPSQVIEALRDSNFMGIIAALGPISAALGGLVWIFALYNLEDKKGQMLLYVALICMVLTAIAVGITSLSTFDNFINSEAFENMINSGSDGTYEYTQLLSNYQWIGGSALLSVIGNVVSNLLLLFALYIPYQRIKTGDLVPIAVTPKQAGGQPGRVCPNCGKAIPFDANNCPYCGKIFDSYL